MKRHLMVNKDFKIVVRPIVKNINKKVKKSNFSVVNYINIGYYILTPLLVGVFLGLIIDRWLGLKGSFVILFIFFGTLAAFYNLYKIYKNG